MSDESSVVDLVERAGQGDKAAWDRIVERYAPLLWSVCRRYDLSGADADDVAANTWLRLVERLSTLREPAALPGWLATTTQRECLQLLRRRNRLIPTGQRADATDASAAELDNMLLLEERRVALRIAFDDLSERCRMLLGMLFAEPPLSYSEICDALGLAVGAIGPARQRCLARLRRNPALVAFAERPPAETLGTT